LHAAHDSCGQYANFALHMIARTQAQENLLCCSRAPMRVGGPEAPREVSVHFALTTPKSGAHAELLAILQQQIVAPLVSRGMLSEFRVLSATPSSFMADASTYVVFELVVPCPWPVTDRDVQQWQKQLGKNVQLYVMPTKAPRNTDSWDSQRARSVLARAMVMGPTKKEVTASRTSSWLTECISRTDNFDDNELIPADASEIPSLSVVDEDTGRRLRVPDKGTLMSEAIAREICPHLPVALRWKSAWRLLYSPRVHGVSLPTFFRKMEDEGPSLLLIQDHSGHVFGGFASLAWHVADRYFGDGESFVFRFKYPLPKPVVPLQIEQLAQEMQEQEQKEGQQGEQERQDMREMQEKEDKASLDKIQQAIKALGTWRESVQLETERATRKSAHASPTEALDAVLGTPLFPTQNKSAPAGNISEETKETNDSKTALTPGLPDGASKGMGANPCEELSMEVFPWSLKDPFFLFSDMDCLAMGGGSAFALYIEKDLLHGMSEPCSTFGSEMLSSTQNFIISDLECWVFDDPSEVNLS